MLYSVHRILLTVFVLMEESKREKLHCGFQGRPLQADVQIVVLVALQTCQNANRRDDPRRDPRYAGGYSDGYMPAGPRDAAPAAYARAGAVRFREADCSTSRVAQTRAASGNWSAAI